MALTVYRAPIPHVEGTPFYVRHLYIKLGRVCQKSLHEQQPNRVTRRAMTRYQNCRQDTHSQHTSVHYSLFTSAERTSRTWLKRASKAELNLSSGVAHVSPVVVLSPAVYHEHIIFVIHSFYNHTRIRSTIGSIRSSSRTPVHHAHLQAPSVDKQRHQESLWRENLQSGGNPRNTFSHRL